HCQVSPAQKCTQGESRLRFGCHISAVGYAVALGTDMLELDCHMTKDEQVVVSHDDNLKRATGVNVSIADLKFSELPPYLWKLECCCEGGDDKRIPLLKEVFEEFPNTPVNIDIKVNNDVLIQKVSELVKEYNRQDLTVWGNASDDLTCNVFAFICSQNSTIPILFSLQRVLLLVGLFYTGLLPFYPLREQFLEIPMPSIFCCCICLRSHFFFLSALSLLMRKALFEHLKARGIQVYIWVLNDEDDFKRAFDLGATGVMSDYPTRLKKFMELYFPKEQ
uniref:Glycerophosphodiester phosphodiesterase domain containing 1 n=1 Tax=Callorhinchus milii TaxID=7868 RepID=A0A4W3JRP4_CALMI